MTNTKAAAMPMPAPMPAPKGSDGVCKVEEEAEGEVIGKIVSKVGLEDTTEL